MCGIFALLNYSEISELVTKSFIRGSSRGPENSKIEIYNSNIIIGFHRLAINGLNEYSNQPLNIGGIVLVCNGEIYNYKHLAKEHNIKLKTGSDCEIIVRMYQLYGMEYTLGLLDGVFSLFLYDTEINTCYAARDPYGVRPLYCFIENDTIGFASEIKSLYNLVKYKPNIFEFEPGNYVIINDTLKVNRYISFPFREIQYNDVFGEDCTKLNKQIVGYLENAVKKRIDGTTDRPIACLLSGGLDSSLVCALVNKYYNKKLETYSIGLPGSEDLKYARIVADHLNTNHHEIIIDEQTFFDSIPEVIHKIESYDTTTVRASVGNYLIAKYIKNNSEAKVIFNGDGADEIMGGYLYFHKAPNEYEFDKECKRLLTDISKFDVLRSDRCIASNGLEARTPFLDKSFVDFYLSIPKILRYHPNGGKCEKYLIRNAFSKIIPDLLPDCVLWRTKEAFSDGVSSLNRSWFSVIHDNINKLCEKDNALNKNLDQTIEIYKKLRLHNPPITIEQSYYRYIYNKHYRDTDYIIPYFWMPKFIDSTDSSARTLKIYSELKN